MNRSKDKHVTMTNRRSSLRVNLSFDTNSIDSGNGSCIKNQLNLTDDSRKEQVLNENCRLLKDAILMKTRELFDERNELARKTKSILIIDENVAYDNTPRTVDRKSLCRSIDKSKLSQKRLFVDDSHVERNALKEIDISPITKTRIVTRSYYHSRSKCVDDDGDIVCSTPIERNRTKIDAISMELTKIPSYRKSKNDGECSMRMNTSVDTIANNNNKNNTNSINLSNDTIIVENSSTRTENCLADDEAGVVIEDSMIEEELVILPKGKRKLLPLRDDSRVYSFSPVEEIESLTPKPPKEFKKKMKKHKKPILKVKSIEKVRIDIDDDEGSMKEKKVEVKKKHRKVVSKKIIIKKIPKYDVMDRLELNVDRNRPSTSDFHSDGTNCTGRVRSKSKKLFLVVTGYSKSDKSLVKSVINCIGIGQLQLQVTKHTTHVITTGVRTINLLRGIIRGCWLVNLEWALRSLEHKQWLNPEQFEISHFSKAVQENRRARQMFGTAYVPELFFSCGLVHVENDTKPPRDALNELIKLAGGRIIEDSKLAKIIIGPNGLRESWVLDSITTGELQKFDQYRVQS